MRVTAGQPFQIHAIGPEVKYWEIAIGSERYSFEGSEVMFSAVAHEPGEISIVIEATTAQGQQRTIRQSLISGTIRDRLVASWIEHIALDDGTLRRADAVTAPGQCKQYLIDSFALVSKEYALENSPSATLVMPSQANNPETSGRVSGAGWELPPQEEGNPFIEAAHYDYQASASVRENRQMIRDLLEQAQPGDVLQMMAVYNNGVRGTHTMLIAKPYDVQRDTLYWSDSNFRVRYVDGVRHAYVVANQERALDELIDWLMNSGCGATLYRICDDIVYRQSSSIGPMDPMETE